jgi:Protein of unknown function (DUF3800)
MLQVWLDDSGKGQMPAFVLAGYFAPLDNWSDFSDAWKPLLAKKPRPLEYLKYYEAFGLRHQFKGWTVDDRDARLLEFVPLISKASGQGIAFVIDHAAFDVIVRDAPETPFKNPYTLAYFLSLTTILPVVQDAFAFTFEKLEIIFDEGVVHPREAEAAYQHLFTLAPHLAATLADTKPRFENDKLQMPLQAADLLAGCARADHDPDLKYDRVRKSPVFSALRDITTALVTVDGDAMQYWRDRVEKGIPRLTGITKVRKW